MRLILTILLIGLFKADAQMVINASAPYRPFASVGNLLLDQYPANAAFSLRKLRTDYTGAAIRVRRDTTGQPEKDINFLSSGELDTVDLKDFIRNRSAFVVTWYDQSGVSPNRNSTQTTQANQPRIALNGVIDRDASKPCVRFNDNTDFLTCAPTGYAFTEITTVGKVNTQNVVNYIVASPTGGFFYNGSFAGVNGLGGFDGTNFRSTTGEDLNRHLGWFSLRSSTLFVARDGGAESNVGSFNAFNLDAIGSRFGGNTSITFIGNIQEVIAWNTGVNSNKTAIENNINSFYSIY